METVTGERGVPLATEATAALILAAVSGESTGQATAAKQDTAQTTLTAIDGHVDGLEASATSIDGKIPAKGTAAMAGSTPVTLATDDALLSAAAPVANAVAPVQITLGASVVMSAQAVKRFVRVTALIGNGNPAYIRNDGGTASATAGDELNPGDTKDYPVTNANKLSTFGTASDKLNVSFF